MKFLATHWDIFTALCPNIRGPLVNDAYLAALAIEHGCELIATDSDAVGIAIARGDLRTIEVLARHGATWEIHMQPPKCVTYADIVATGLPRAMNVLAVYNDVDTAVLVGLRQRRQHTCPPTRVVPERRPQLEGGRANDTARHKCRTPSRTAPPAPILAGMRLRPPRSVSRCERFACRIESSCPYHDPQADWPHQA